PLAGRSRGGAAGSGRVDTHGCDGTGEERLRGESCVTAGEVVLVGAPRRARPSDPGYSCAVSEDSRGAEQGDTEGDDPPALTLLCPPSRGPPWWTRSVTVKRLSLRHTELGSRGT